MKVIKLEKFLRKSNKHLLTNLQIYYKPLSIDLEDKDKVENQEIEKNALQAMKESNEKKAKFTFRF